MAIDSPVGRPLSPRRPLPAATIGARAARPLDDNAVIVGRHDLSDSVARFLIRPDDVPPPVEPGQYRTLGVVVDGRIVQRPYSPATPAGVHPELEFLIRRVRGGTLTPLLWTLEVGDRLRVGRPKGLFTRIPGDRRTHLLIATGTGLAPLVGMLETSLLEPDPPRTLMVHGVAHVPELAYRERFECWAADGRVTYVPSISRPGEPSNADWTGRTGRIDAVLDAEFALNELDPEDTVAYLCGHPGMIAAGTAILMRRGLPDDAIRTEQYWPG
jgi:ferredoxin--NADP+ reductase